MGKITKKATEKHKVSLSPALVDFIQKTTNLPLAELRSHLSSLPTRWPFPRGDLYNWIEPLDRFDNILQKFNENYRLDRGPQTRTFGTSILLEGSPGYDQSKLDALGFGQDGDRELVEAILSFSRLLLEKCGNRALYNSSDRLNDLLNTTSLSLLHSTLRITVFLALRYSERAPNAVQQPHYQFYSYDHDRLNRLASSLAPLSPPMPKRASSTPAKTVKGKDKATQPGRLRRSSTSVNPNNFKALSSDSAKERNTHVAPVSQTSSEQDWQQWASVKVSWAPTPAEMTLTDALPGQPPAQDTPPTPTPVRRQPSMLSRTSTSNGNVESPAVSNAVVTTERSGMEISLSASDLSKTTAEQMLLCIPPTMPQTVQYEFLHKLRIAYGLMTSSESRQTLLTIRLLALAILAYIYDEQEFPQKVFGSDANLSVRSQLVHQIVSLVQSNKQEPETTSLYLQTLAMECLSVLARQKTLANEITVALAPNSSHGLLLSLTQKGLNDLRQDGDASDDDIGDDWREAIFSLLSAFMLHGMHSARSSETVIHPSLISTYASGLNIITGKSLRVHLRILDFMKTFFHHFKDGLAVLSANKAFEAACELLGNLSRSALDLLRNGHGMPDEFKTKVTDYQIPYMHQQVIRSMVDLVNDIIGHQGGHAERILRNLVDSQSLLGAFRLILSNIEAFGAHTWSEVTKAIVGFLHNEPTSYTIISEAGIIKTLLDMVAPTDVSGSSDDNKVIDDVPQHCSLQIPANGDAIVNLSQAFGAICLTNTGFDSFKTTGALEKFFEIFESPAHVKVLKDSNTLAMLGSTFDELVRHHPQLRNTVMSTVIVMMARVRYICRKQASIVGAGAKLWLDTPAGGLTVSGGTEALINDFVSHSSPEGPSLKTIQLPDGRTLQFKPSIEHVSLPDLESAKETDADGLTILDHARPAICFLLNFFENQSLCSFFMEQGASDIVLDFATLPAISSDDQTFGREGIAHELASLIHMMAETKPHLVLPVLADRTRLICKEALGDFSSKQPSTFDCYFEAFVKKQTDAETMEIDEAHLPVATSKGTETVKGLTAVLTLTTVLSEIFNMPIFTNRAVGTTAIFLQVNIADIISDVTRLLGSIAAACYREEIALQRAIPESWLSATRPGGFSTGDDEVDKALSVQDTTAGNPTSDNEKSDDPAAGNNDAMKRDKQSALFRNVQTLRYLLIETPAAISDLLQRLGRGIVMKRRMDGLAKHKSNMVAAAIADAYMAQIDPYFLPSAEEAVEEAKTKEARFAYLLIALAYVRGSLTDDSPNHGQNAARQALVVDYFCKAGGLKRLTAIGNELFDELKSCKVAQSMFSANTGLKHCLDILDDLTAFQNICESCQGAWMKENNLTKPFSFNPAQLLLELRMEAMSLTRRIWDSEYADQASADVVQKLVSILKHVFNGDSESEAVQSANNYPKIPTHQRRKFGINKDVVSKIAAEKHCDESLVREAMFRSNCSGSSNTKPIEEYCDAVKDNPRRRRLIVPDEEVDSTSTATTSGLRSPANNSFANAAALLQTVANEGGIEATLAEVVGNLADNDMDDVDDDPLSDTVQTTTENTSSAMDISNILNRPEGNSTELQGRQEVTEPQAPLYTVETIDAERESIREDLAERCNNILNNHQGLTFELSELIAAATKKLSDDATKSYWDGTCDLLINALLSRQADGEMSEAHGKKIAAAAHLIALLIQDNDVFKSTLRSFQDSFDGLLSFLRLPPVTPQNSEDSTCPWVAPILLILERMLSLDAEPAEVKWEQPQDMEPASEARLTHTSVFDIDQKKELFELLINLLPRVGKDKSMGLSMVRVLVILTRVRSIAVMQGLRGNLQKLFLMVKQLGSGANGRLQSSFVLVLRHIIEDDETVKQIMRSEITANFLSRSTRPPDIQTYVRDNYHLVLRSPELFVDVSNEKVKLAGWSHQSGASTLMLKEAAEDQTPSDDQMQPPNGSGSSSLPNQPTTSIEAADPAHQDADNIKAPDIKPPVVEHPDGVIHFLLSELLAYKDVDDKDPSKVAEDEPSGAEAKQDVEVQGAQPQTPGAESDLPVNDKQEKAKFKADDHPMFLYRCFILHCLAELLYSYNRTKIEFINFSRKADPMAVTPSKPRSGILNYLLNALVSSGYVDKDETIICKKKMVLSDWAIKVIVALCSKTGEMGLTTAAQRFGHQAQVDDSDTEPDLAFVRRFVLEHAMRSFKEATSSVEPLQMKYSRLLCLANLFRRLLVKPTGPDGAAGSHNNSYKMLARMMFEKNLISVLTASLAEIDLSFPSAKKVIKFILRPLQELTTTAVHLSINSPEAISSVVGNDLDDVISSASSVSDVENDREDTPDLFRNSALGMLDPSRQGESDTSEEEDDDEEMYDDEYDDEMEYDDGMPAPNDGEVVSDEEIEEGMADAGPIEGLPGDVPMDIEFVVNDPHDIQSDDDEEISEDDDEDDSDDDDEDNDDFEIEMDDDDGEINADDENDSLGEGNEDEGEWEDEDEDVDEDDEDEDDEGLEGDVTFETNDIPMPPDMVVPDGTHAELNNLLRALGEQDLEGHGMPPLPPIIVQDEQSDHEQDDEEDDEEEDEDGIEENFGLDFEDGFNVMADGLDDLDNDGHWDAWGEPTAAIFRRHRQSVLPGRQGMPSFISRRIHALGDHHDLPHQVIGRHHRHPPQPRSGVDDGTNPLLQRSDSNRAARGAVDGSYFAFSSPHDPIGMPPRGLGGSGMISVPIPVDINITSGNSNFAAVGAHGAILDSIVQALQRGDRNILQAAQLSNGGMQVQFNTGPFEDMRHLVRSGGAGPHGRHLREDPHRAASFTPLLTFSRWQEEARMLFGSTYVDKTQRVQILLLSKLVPFAQVEEKERRRKRAEEEARRKKEEEEAEQRRQEEERLRKEQEEREAAERAEAEAKVRLEAEAAAAAAAAEAANRGEQYSEVTEPMEGVQVSNEHDNEEAEVGEDGTGAAEPARIYTTIRGRQLNITGLSIDLEYLEALPEDLREEVIMQQYTERREQAQEEGGDASAIDPDFLDALPEDIRDEIRQHELHNQRRRQREEARRQAQHAAGAAQAEDMDNDNFLATLDPALRRAILAEQPPEILAQLDPRHAAEGRAQQRGLFMNRMMDGRGPRLDERARRDAAHRDNKRQVVQLIDKAGVATLLRLMFVQQQGSLKQTLWAILGNVCGNRQTRFEVVSLLLVILKEGSTDITAVERSLANLSLRAKATAAQKTPQPLKRTLSMPPQVGLSEEMTPMIVVQQCLSALQALCRLGPHLRTIFVREVDVGSSKAVIKSKGKDVKTTKYPINDLISLLDRRIIMDSSHCLQLLAELLAAVSLPLQELLARKDKEQSESKQNDAQEDAQNEMQQAASSTQDPPLAASEQDTAMVEAPSASQEASASMPNTQDTSIDKQDPTTEGQETIQDDKKKPFEAPVISEHNLQLITSVFVAPECHGETFRSTLMTLQSLSRIPGTSVVFSKELVNHVQMLSQAICGDLDDLLPLIREAQSTSDLQGITSAKFSSSSSDQIKLLRVLQALDYLSTPKKENDVEDESATVKSVLNSSYDSLSLGPLWSKLSDCLTAVREKGDTIGFANILLPLIESLMVVCKNTPLKDAPVTGQAQEVNLTSPAPESMNDLEELFFKFTAEHRKILNDIVRQNPKLMQGIGNFGLLVKNSKVLDFDNKRNYFTKQIHSSHRSRHVQPPLQLSVRREHVFLDSFKNLYFKSAEEMKHGKLNIRFLGEEGVDAGGVTREWFQVLARGMFDANYALFQPVASDRTTFHPNPLSNINDQHLLYFKFIGRIIGKALYEGRVLDCHFSRAVYKRILGKSPNLKDLESNDVDYYKSLIWILENDITDILTEEFCVIENNFGEDKIIDLIPDGRNISVTEENKREYVQKLVEYRLTESVKDQLDNFLQGFHDIIPAELIAIFNEQELELLISGLPEIDVDDWKAHTEYHNYSPSSPQIVWFWRIVRGMTNEERAKLLQFITGTSKVPLNGFKELEGVSGLTKHNIHKDPSTNRLPTSHTCFNQLDLPAYDSFELMKQNITTAISLGADYFGFA